MIRLFVLCIALFAAGIAQAQIPNPGFESWTSDTLDGWVTIFPGSISQSSAAHSGASAVRGEVVNNFINIPPILYAGDEGIGFPVTQRYATFSGYYQFNSVGGDAFIVTIGMIQGGAVIGAGEFITTVTQSGYAAFNASIDYAGPGDPDSAFIIVLIADTTENADVDIGSFFIVDDLSLSGITDVGDHTGSPEQFSLAQNYPNPFNPSTSITFTLPSAEFVSLKVFDVLGREVGTLASEHLPLGTHTRQWDGSGQPGGVYLCRIQAGDFTATRKLVLMK